MTAEHPRAWLRDASSIVGIIAKLGAIALGVLALVQYRDAKARERRQVAIEAVTHVKSKDLVDALARLEDHYDRNDLKYDGVQSDVAYVMSWYDHVAMLYLADGLADRCIIKRSLAPQIATIQRVLNEMQYPAHWRHNFDVLASRMPLERCE